MKLNVRVVLLDETNQFGWIDRRDVVMPNHLNSSQAAKFFDYTRILSAREASIVGGQIVRFIFWLGKLQETAGIRDVCFQRIVYL